MALYGQNNSRKLVQNQTTIIISSATPVSLPTPTPFPKAPSPITHEDSLPTLIAIPDDNMEDVTSLYYSGFKNGILTFFGLAILIFVAAWGSFHALKRGYLPLLTKLFNSFKRKRREEYEFQELELVDDDLDALVFDSGLLYDSHQEN